MVLIDRRISKAFDNRIVNDTRESFFYLSKKVLQKENHDKSEERFLIRVKKKTGKIVLLCMS